MSALLSLLLVQHIDLAQSHPTIPCWRGERTWTAEGEPPSPTTVFGTGEEEIEVTIHHNRDQIRTGDALKQDYNFLDYRFPSQPEVHARVYLWQPETVMVSIGTEAGPFTLDELRRTVGDQILCYLQKRFQVIEAPAGDAGYATVWTASEAASR